MTRADGQRVRLSPSDWLGITALVLGVLLPLLAFMNSLAMDIAVITNDLEHVRADVQEIKTQGIHRNATN